MKKTALLLALLCAAVAGCRNMYDNPTFLRTDTYEETFHGKRIPQDLH